MFYRFYVLLQIVPNRLNAIRSLRNMAKTSKGAVFTIVNGELVLFLTKKRELSGRIFDSDDEFIDA